MKLPFTKKIRVRIFISLLVLGLGIGGGIAYYLITEKFEDTKQVKADYSLSAPVSYTHLTLPTTSRV